MKKLSKDVEPFTLPDFVEIQTKSFQRFLQFYLIEELQRFPIIKHPEGIEFQLFPEKYRLSKPILKEREVVSKLETYEVKLYILAQVVNTNNGITRLQSISIGSIPIMTSQGTFVINGVSWVIVSQILRNPGIYYTKNHEGIENATIIFSPRLEIDTEVKGRFVNKSIKIEIDKKGRIWARITGKSKIPLLLLLLAMGSKINEIPSEILNKQRTYKLDEILMDLQNKLIAVYDQVRDTNESRVRDSLIPQVLIQRLKQIYHLGFIGRANLNNRLRLKIKKNETSLLTEDIIAAANYLLKVRAGLGYLDDIDHLNNKYVKSVGDLFREQFRIALVSLSKTILRNLRIAVTKRRLPSPKTLISTSILKSTFSHFFGSHELSQYLDQTNPLADIIHKRKMSLLGPGGLTRTTASFRVRDIHPSYYGRICPIATAEGLNAGLICSLATYAKINYQGIIQNLVYKNISGINGNNKYLDYINAGKDEELKIAIGTCLAVGQTSQQEESTPALYKQEFVFMPWNEAKIRSILHVQYLSVGASLIPFLEHDDANRALMGSTMQRQAVPLIIPSKPVVGTGFEAQIALDSGVLLTALSDGYIEYVDAKVIQQRNLDHTINKIPLLNYQNSNNGTCIHQKPIVQSGEVIRRGQIIADGAVTVKGELALGKNILVAYMPWEGYNFEDAILISERLIYEDIFTSLHIEKYSIETYVTDLGDEKITREIPHLNEYLLRHLDTTGLVKVGSWVEPGDILVGKLTPIEPQDEFRSPEGRLMQAIFGLQELTSKENCLKVPPGGKGRVIDVKIFNDQWLSENNTTISHIKLVHVYILQKRRIQVGDKIAGRHGNKGIVSKILMKQDMPYMQDGTPVDMVLSPLGVPSRMNVGQIFECLLGLAGSILKRNYRIMPFDERYEKEASRKFVFSELDLARRKTGFSWLFEPDTPGKTRLFDGRTGQVFDQPVTVGKAYMLKLIHQVDDKIHARSTGPYALVTQQPLRGRSNHGGQRIGEMEVWAIEGFGAAYILQEMLTIKSDHITARSKVLGAIVSGESIPKPVGPTECFRLLVRELRCLGIQISHDVISSKNLNIYQSEI
uniref:DNA-directed RNA polymerase subunit beta n=1 Tax=Spirogyra maxima TaxID=3180 RepID=A0A191T4K5_SPIMX|nr:beta subunit of RNA polymerase [Spirogyra maxima]ANI25317.1 beta subunit of RNA polymerase [Spirogyra maxima]